MRNKQAANVLLFTIAVIALLLRPYFVYQLTENLHITKDPIAVNSLLQRLIKKKDDHHAVNASELLAIRPVENKVAPGRPQQPLAGKMNAALEFAFYPKQAGRYSGFHPSPAYYKLFSTFRI